MSWSFRFLCRSVEDFVKSMCVLRPRGPCVTIFGSARLGENTPSYQIARDLGKLLGAAGFTIMTGGGPGLMEAVNRGAKDAGSQSLGCRINFSFNEPANRYLDRYSTVRYFFVRKVVMCKPAMGFAVLPGGIGTLDELFEVLTLIQTKRMPPKPIVLLGRHYWRPLMILLEEMMAAGTISEKDRMLVKVTDDLPAAVGFLRDPAGCAIAEAVDSEGIRRSRAASVKQNVAVSRARG